MAVFAGYAGVDVRIVRVGGYVGARVNASMAAAAGEVVGAPVGGGAPGRIGEGSLAVGVAVEALAGVGGFIIGGGCVVLEPYRLRGEAGEGRVVGGGIGYYVIVVALFAVHAEAAGGGGGSVTPVRGLRFVHGVAGGGGGERSGRLAVASGAGVLGAH